MAFITNCSINVPLSKMKNKIPWLHTVMRCAVHAEGLRQNRLLLRTLLGLSNSHCRYVFIFTTAHLNHFMFFSFKHNSSTVLLSTPTPLYPSILHSCSPYKAWRTSSLKNKSACYFDIM
jgi:hypothetical protein